jgi:hypothetical protein
MSKLANELTLIRHMIEVGYRRKHAKNHIPSLLLDENGFHLITEILITNSSQNTTINILITLNKLNSQ